MGKRIIAVSLIVILELFLPRFIHAQEWLSQFSLVEDRFKTDLTLKAAFGSVIVSNRSRFEWQNMEADPRSRYRNRTQFDYPAIFWGQKLTPYLASEFIYNVKGDSFEENRNVLGVSKKVGKNLKTSLFYMIKHTSSDSLDDDGRLIGAQFDLFFD